MQIRISLIIPPWRYIKCTYEDSFSKKIPLHYVHIFGWKQIRIFVVVLQRIVLYSMHDKGSIFPKYQSIGQLINFFKSYHHLPKRDSILRPIHKTPISSVAGGEITTRPVVKLESR
jgi:hypothetical protein